MALATKTVVFVTHQVEFLPAADLILVFPLMLPTPCHFQFLKWLTFCSIMGLILCLLV